MLKTRQSAQEKFVVTDTDKSNTIKAVSGRFHLTRKVNDVSFEIENKKKDNIRRSGLRKFHKDSQYHTLKFQRVSSQKCEVGLRSYEREKYFLINC